MCDPMYIKNCVYKFETFIISMLYPFHFFDNKKPFYIMKACCKINIYYLLKWQASRDVLLQVFSRSISPKPMTTTLGSLQFFFQNFAEIFACQVAPQLSRTPVHLEQRIYPHIFKKIIKGPKGILSGSWKTDSWQKTEVKNLVALPL